MENHLQDEGEVQSIVEGSVDHEEAVFINGAPCVLNEHSEEVVVEDVNTRSDIIGVVMGLEVANLAVLVPTVVVVEVEGHLLNFTKDAGHVILDHSSFFRQAHVLQSSWRHMICGALLDAHCMLWPSGTCMSQLVKCSNKLAKCSNKLVKSTKRANTQFTGA